MVLETLFQESSQVLALIPRLIYSNNCYVAWNVRSGIIYFIKFAPCSFLIHICIIGKCDWNYFTVNRKHENFAKKKVFQRNLGLNIFKLAAFFFCWNLATLLNFCYILWKNHAFLISITLYVKKYVITIHISMWVNGRYRWYCEDIMLIMLIFFMLQLIFFHVIYYSWNVVSCSFSIFFFKNCNWRQKSSYRE